MIALIAGPGKPPRSVQGLGLPYLAAVLEEAGLTARIFDLYPESAATDDAAVLDGLLAETIAGYDPLIVGITIHTPAYAERVRLARLLRERLPDALLIAGGHHPCAEPEDLLRNSDFDVCAVGEAEETLLEIAQGVARGQRRDSTAWLRGIRGLVYRRDDEIVPTPARPPVDDLDSLPFPAHHLLGLENYAPHPVLGVKSTGIVTYRGCPMRCAFCANAQGSRMRKRSPAKVVEEISRVVERWDVSGFNFYDNLFGIDREHALAVCDEIIGSGLEVIWDCWTAGDLVDPELAGRMKAAGCVRVGFGAESGDDEVLFKARRGFTVEQHQAGLDVLRAAGLKVEAFFMIGLPGESEESVERTVDFAATCGAGEVCLGVYRPYPGSEVWSHPEAFGVRVVRGPSFEAYIETEKLSRAAMLGCARRAGEELERRGLQVEFLRMDEYSWE
jgi:radical SAM superfamily enzyme YgiQ (UPF0313 family)